MFKNTTNSKFQKINTEQNIKDILHLQISNKFLARSEHEKNS
jgi:hypothetical protein